MNDGLSVGLSIIDLKAIASTVVQSVAGPLFMVRRGPDSWAINRALEKVRDGDAEAQAALDAIGVDWRDMYAAVKR
ncbi:hypothetical protein D3C86_1295050 [compost metagenome]